ncbi:lytic polysaccharide monooxygenase [Lophiostoma macrostomum CBS 122681]|uniref:lytic cellulose monooxygenase (C4-dehydrogenating) n=1 Tax=Lophiostoma macrostomum CBS 122681 TaxID=1314788 RepID=A0A6A6T9V0_9PLEO|nr:lytic polysaccharide monooxygenase [Lophiostoma macrostomum CBS 122681]
MVGVLGIHPVQHLVLLFMTRAVYEYANRHISPNQPASNPPLDYDYIIPVVDPSLLDLRCGRNASKAWSTPKTATIWAGDTVGFAVNTTVGSPVIGAPVNPWDRYPNLYHPGPATAWLSKAPGDLDTYEGDGDWFKILSVVNRTAQSVPPNDEYYWKHQWGTYQATNWTFEIPTATPPGDYLLRFEHIYPLPVDSLQGSQFYVNCAHVRILNPSISNAESPGPTTKIPGVYTFGQKEIYFYADVGTETYNISDFVEPAPRVWTGL